MRRSAVAAALFVVFVAIAPSWAARPQDEPVQLPNAIDVNLWNDGQSMLARASVVLGRFKSDPKMVDLMRQARGIFVIPAFGHGSGATLISGQAWASGVLLANKNGQWSDPAFFSMGGGSLGPHTTANGGALLLFIMNDRAMSKFASRSNWSLSSAPGSTIANYSSATPQDLSGHGADIVAWSAAGGPNSDTEISIADLSFDTAMNMTVYGTSDLRHILANDTPYINQTVISMRRQMPSAATTATAQNRPPKDG
jgi:SH3 domain-containing YSC84-like protein 1